METPQVSALDAGFSYGRHVALRDFTLQAGPGKVVLLLGLNGAGKSTALSILSGKVRPRLGQVRICGGDPRRASVRRHLWLLEEVASPAVHLTARESVAFYLDLYGKPGSRKAIIEEVLTTVGLMDRSRKRAATFSKGMRRRLELACLAAVDPPVWLLDEPQTGLDPQGLRLLKELCLAARQRGRTIIMASHALSDVPALADEVHILKDGTTVFTGDRDGLMAKIRSRGYVVSGEDRGFEVAMRAAAADHGVHVDGPSVPTDPLEALLFQEEEDSP